MISHSQDNTSERVILAVAPNGARKMKTDHSLLPMSASEIAIDAARCRDAGASLLHLHVRDKAGHHSLNTDLYREAIAAVRRSINEDLLIQITTESAGIFAPDEQMECVRSVKPEAVSLAIKELAPDEAAIPVASSFFDWLWNERILAQYIIYTPKELNWFLNLVKRGVVPGATHFLQFVLGRYSENQQSSLEDLEGFLALPSESYHWSVCAFGKNEQSCVLGAIAKGGHARVGFENNIFLPNGQKAPDNAALVQGIADSIPASGRLLADGRQTRELLVNTLKS